MNHLNNTLSRRGVLFLSAAFLLVAAISVSCKKKGSRIGKGVLTEEDLLSSGGVDTFRLYSYSEKIDNLPTSNTTTGMVGSYHDPKLGLVTASLYTQVFGSGALALSPSDVITVDSVVLSLEYRGFYGTTSPMNFEVYRLDDTLSVNSTYYKTSTEPHQGGDLVAPGMGTVTPNPGKYFNLGTDSLKPQLRLKLSNTFGDGILQDARTNPTIFNDNDKFVQEYFKGLHILTTSTNPSPGTGAIYLFNMNASQSKVTIYYKVNAEDDQFTYELKTASTKYTEFNHIDIDNTGYDILDVIANPLTNSMESYYAQANNAYGVLEMPSLRNLPKRCIVHNALLSIPVAFHTSSPYYTSTRIVIGYKDTDGKVKGFTTAFYDPDSGKYLADVRDYAQAVVLGEADYTKLYIYPFNMTTSAERIVFNGPNTTNKYKPKLIIKYTEY